MCLISCHLELYEYLIEYFYWYYYIEFNFAAYYDRLCRYLTCMYSTNNCKILILPIKLKYLDIDRGYKSSHLKDSRTKRNGTVSQLVICICLFSITSCSWEES